MTARKTAPKSKTRASGSATGKAKPSAAKRTAKPSAKTVASQKVEAPKAESPKVQTRAEDGQVEAKKIEAQKAPAPKAETQPAKKQTAAAEPAAAPAAAEKKPEAPKVPEKAEEAKAAKVAEDNVKKTAPAPVVQKAATQSIAKGKDIMANTTEKMTDQTSKMMGDMSERAKAASQKTTQMMTQAGDLGRGNVEAFVEAGKIGAEAFQELGRDNMEFAKKSFEESSSAMKNLSSIKSPTELFQLQGEMARKNFDVMVEQASKNTEKMVKLMGDMFQPISNRMAEAGEKMKIDA